MSDSERLIKLQTENARLIALLESQGIEWQSTQQAITIWPPVLPTKAGASKYTLEDRISIFRTLFRGRSDVYPILSSIQPITPIAVGSIISQAADQRHPLDITFINEANDIEPWQQTHSQKNRKLDGSFPSSLTATLANMLYFEKDYLPQSLINRLIRLAAFQNPEFY